MAVKSQQASLLILKNFKSLYRKDSNLLSVNTHTNFSNRNYYTFCIYITSQVLILVLMEDTLRESKTYESFV